MEECIKKEYISFIQKQLAEMAKTVKKNSSKNQAKREKSQCSFLEGNMVQNVCLILLFYIMLVLP